MKAKRRSQPDPPPKKKDGNKRVTATKRSKEDSKQYAKNIKPIAKGLYDFSEDVKPWELDQLFSKVNGKSIHDMVAKAAEETRVPKSMIYANIQEEGLSDYMKKYSEGKLDEVYEALNTVDPENLYPSEKFHISGHGFLGLDTFAEPNVQKKIKEIYPDYFQEGKNYTIEEFANEDQTGNVYKSARFNNLEDAIKANAAMLAAERKNVERVAQEKGINLSDDQLDFFNYVGYNSGPGRAQDMLEHYNEKGYLKDDSFLKSEPDDKYSHGPYPYAMRRFANKKMFDDVFFDQDIVIPEPVKPMGGLIPVDKKEKAIAKKKETTEDYAL